MAVVRKVIRIIVSTKTCLCYLSFRTGIFPDKLKTATVIPLQRAEDMHIFIDCRAYFSTTVFQETRKSVCSKA